MVDCPKCGKEMKVGAIIPSTSEPLYNCDNCGIDCWSPPEPKKIVEPPKELEEPEIPPEEPSEKEPKKITFKRKRKKK